MQSLPIDPYLPSIRQKLLDGDHLILTADPGTGKTTRIPPYLAKLGPCLVLQPRRLASTLAAKRVAQEQTWRLGQDVGYMTRYESQYEAETPLIYATEGLFLRLLKQDPLLQRFNFVVFDEFHERHLNTDCNFAILRQLQMQSDKAPKLLIMSATMELSRLQSHFAENFQHCHIPGQTYPVHIEYQPQYDPQKPEAIAAAIADLFASMPDQGGDILVFLTGQAQIRSVQKACLQHDSEILAKQTEILPLYASLPGKEQERIFRKTEKSKIILATNVAETSITFPNVRAVIDCGMAKQANFAIWSGLPSLAITRISQQAAIQRAGRAGRTAKGIVWRLYSEDDYKRREKHETYEIQRSDLSQTVLELELELAGREKTISVSFKDLPWLEEPSAKYLDIAYKLLQQFEAYDQASGITAHGQRLAELRLHPRLGQMIATAENLGVKSQACLLASLISENFLLTGLYAAVSSSSCDLCYQAKIVLKELRGEKQEHQTIAKAIDRRKLQSIQHVYKQLARHFHLPELKDLDWDQEIEGRLRLSILSGFRDRVAKYRPQARSNKNPNQRYFNFSGGGGGVLHPSSTVTKADYMVVLDAYENLDISNAAFRLQIKAATRVSLEELLTISSMLHTAQDWVEERGRVMQKETIYYGKLPLQTQEKTFSADEREEQLLNLVRERWPHPFSDDLALQCYHHKLDLLECYGIEHNLPRFHGELWDLFLAELVLGKSSLAEIGERALESYIHDQLSPAEESLLHLYFPQKLKLPNGRMTPIHWIEGKFCLKLKIQDAFGWQETPRICLGRHPLQLILLAPNQRPAQITDDLARFWQGSYENVRKELKRRYPKHDWPEDPTQLKDRIQ
ncbi:MAG: ATP-dependent helicase C-terminal domain-containing protein [Oligoflexus sp.]